MANKKSKTLSRYRSIQAAEKVAWVGKYAMALAPAGILTAVNWESWFENAGTSLPAGLSMMIVSTLLAIVGISKKDDIVGKKLSALFYLSIVFFCFAMSFKFLSNICNQMGDVFMWTSFGVLAGAVTDEVDKEVLVPLQLEYKELIDTNELSRSSKKKAERKRLAQAEAMERQATE